MRLPSEEPLIYELTQLVLRSKEVRIRRMHEIEKAGLEDPLLPNTWMDLTNLQVLRRVKKSK
jgi:hypothetical protein